MKKFLLVPMLALSLNLPLIGSQETVQNEPVTVEQTLSPQQKLIDAILADYRAGKYNHFLKQSDEDYKESEKKFTHNDLLEQRKKLSTTLHVHGSEKNSSIHEKIAALHETEHRELMEICLKHPNEKISREVRDMIFFSPSKKEQESIEYIHGLSLKFRGDGLSPLENKLISIDIEFWIKNMILEISHAQKKIDHDSFEKKALVLQLEKLKQMKEACKGGLSDMKIKSSVETAAAVLPKVYASSTTHKHLLALGRGKVAPSTPAEQEMQDVIAKYLDKEATLTEQAYPSK